MKHVVEMTKEQKKVYKQMKEEAIAYLDGKVVIFSYSHDSINETTSNYLWSFYT